LPIYEFQCTGCCHQFDLKRSFGDNSSASCPRCNDEARRVFSPVPIIFKGSGFYVTDNRKEEKSEPSCETDKSSASTIGESKE